MKKDGLLTTVVPPGLCQLDIERSRFRGGSLRLSVGKFVVRFLD